MCTTLRKPIGLHPRKYSLSYSGPSWLAGEPFLDRDSVAQDREEKRKDEGNLPLIARLLRRGSSLRTAESEKVTLFKTTLQIQALAELATHSTNPSAVSISLQALAGLHSISDPSIELLYPLCSRLKEHFDQCFPLSTSQTNFDWASSSPSITERLIRAVLWFKAPILCLDASTRERLLDFCESSIIDPLQSSALVVLLSNRAHFYDGIGLRRSECFSKLITSPPAQRKDVHPWLYSQLTMYPFLLTKDPFLDKERQGRLLTMLSDLHTFDGDLSLQEDLLIRYLHLRKLAATGLEETHIPSTNVRIPLTREKVILS